ncbi:Pectinacetylesterase family protein [Hibiscus syriacus]|uniref:Pectinacetylesterase family protein n=1 Tax=Hibiscus syriacus TaxID=106335 RepID=A0A6A3C876_HIBSY|nr:uncharacterized protein LOC120205567 [Hibiscus syriacus]KAE8723239.1 Pectinacetylesterase family protein [Hibiscus syriacus]
MASDESMTVVSSLQDDEYDDLDVGFHPHNLSRLSMCTNDGDDYDYDDDDDHRHMGMPNDMSRLSIESFDADADVDEECSGKKFLELSSDSDQEPGYYSLPATPPRRRNGTGMLMAVVKDYASENEAQRGGLGRPKGRSGRSKNPRKMRVTRVRRAELSGGKSESKRKDGGNNYSGSFSGESEGGGGVLVITKPKGGNRSLCMDLGEVKACRDLGFELEHERLFEMPGRVSLSGSTFDNTSSGGNSPIANWRISSPGDDPRDVKARLKVWAQAVALASTSRH